MKHVKKFENYDAYDNDSGDTFWGNIGAGILCISKSTNRILVALRSKYVNEPLTYGVIGGKIDEEDGETIQQAALREFEEETGFNNHINLIPSHIFETPNGSFKYYNFIGLIQQEFQPELCWETESYKWVTFEELLSLQDKHFGLETLLKNDLNTIKKYIK